MINMKNKIKKWILNFLLEEGDKWRPVKSRDLKSVSFAQKLPIDGKNYEHKLCHCTEWDNKEGYIFDINSYNELSKQNEDKHLILHLYDLEIMLACLNDLKYFEED